VDQAGVVHFSSSGVFHQVDQLPVGALIHELIRKKKTILVLHDTAVHSHPFGGDLCRSGNQGQSIST
jgi:hypothetical protein